MLFDKAKMQQILDEAKAKASQASQNYLAEWKTKTGGNQYGEPMYCGFAWVDVKTRSNSKLGKLLQENGFKRSWRSGFLNLWDPSGYYGQSMDVKERGAWAYAEHLNANGIPCNWGSRPD